MDDTPNFDEVTKELGTAADPRPGLKQQASVMNAELARLTAVVAPAALNGTYQDWIAQISQARDRTTKAANATDADAAFEVLGTTDHRKTLNDMAKTLGVLPECAG